MPTVRGGHLETRRAKLVPASPGLKSLSSSRSRPLVWLVALLICIGVLAGGTGIVVLAKRSFWSIVPGRSDAQARQTAQDFLRTAARQQPAESCLSVVDNGAIANPCRNDLRKQDDYRRLAQLDPEIRVTQVHLQERSATVSSVDLAPKPAQPLSLRLERTKDGWRVRVLDGHEIQWNGAR